MKLNGASTGIKVYIRVVKLGVELAVMLAGVSHSEDKE